MAVALLENGDLLQKEHLVVRRLLHDLHGAFFSGGLVLGLPDLSVGRRQVHRPQTSLPLVVFLEVLERSHIGLNYMAKALRGFFAFLVLGAHGDY